MPTKVQANRVVEYAITHKANEQAKQRKGEKSVEGKSVEWIESYLTVHNAPPNKLCNSSYHSRCGDGLPDGSTMGGLRPSS